MNSVKSKTQIILFLSMISMLNFSCVGDNKDITKVNRGTGPGNGNTPQKPDPQTKQRALKDKVFIEFTEVSRLLAANAEAAAFRANLNVNDELPNINWDRTFDIKIGGDDLAPVTMGNDHGLDSALKLTVKARRIAKPNPGKTDLGYLILSYDLTRKANNELSAHSLLLLIMDLNLATNPTSKVSNFKKTLVKSELIYPIPENFNLKEWIDKQLKKP